MSERQKLCRVCRKVKVQQSNRQGVCRQCEEDMHTTDDLTDRPEDTIPVFIGDPTGGLE